MEVATTRSSSQPWACGVGSAPETGQKRKPPDLRSVGRLVFLTLELLSTVVAVYRFIPGPERASGLRPETTPGQALLPGSLEVERKKSTRPQNTMRKGAGAAHGPGEFRGGRFQLRPKSSVSGGASLGKDVSGSHSPVFHAGFGPEPRKTPAPDPGIGGGGNGADRGRTDNLLDATEALSQLSYGPRWWVRLDLANHCGTAKCIDLPGGRLEPIQGG